MRYSKLTMILITLISLLALYYVWIKVEQDKDNQEGFISFSMNNVPGPVRRRLAPFLRNIRLFITSTANNIQVNAKRLQRKILK